MARSRRGLRPARRRGPRPPAAAALRPARARRCWPSTSSTSSPSRRRGSGGRAVVELLAHLRRRRRGGARGRWRWSPNRSTIGRWCSAPTAASGRSTDAVHVRAPILEHRTRPLIPGTWSARYLRRPGRRATSTRSCSTFTADGYLREPIGPDALHRGTAELRSYFDRVRSAPAAGIGLEPCARDRRRRAVRASSTTASAGADHDLPPQAGIAVFERDPGRPAGGGARLRRRRSAASSTEGSGTADEHASDRRLRAAVGPAQCRARAAATVRSTGCASRASTARRSSPGCSATQAGHWSVRVAGRRLRSPGATWIARWCWRRRTAPPTGTAVVRRRVGDGRGQPGPRARARTRRTCCSGR